MPAPFLVASLAKLRDEFNALNPSRDKGADGWIGDTAHQATASDHNPDDTPGVATPYTDADTVPEVHALDIDSTGPWPGPFDGYVEAVVDNHRAGRDDRLQNVIWNRQIASRSWGWTWRAYSGADPHTGHAHFSARYTTAQESDVSPWGILEVDMPAAEEIATAVWKDGQAIEVVTGAMAGFFWGALHAARQDDEYVNADAATQKSWRNARDTLRGVLGGPVSQGDILAAIAAVAGVDEQALAGALVLPLAAAVTADLAAKGEALTQDQVEAALRNVLRTGIGA